MTTNQTNGAAGANKLKAYFASTGWLVLKTAIGAVVAVVVITVSILTYFEGQTSKAITDALKPVNTQMQTMSTSIEKINTRLDTIENNQGRIISALDTKGIPVHEVPRK